jgi:hypothetical protein
MNMTDHDDIVRQLREAVATAPPSEDDIAAVAARMRRRRVVRSAFTVGVTAAVVVLAAVTVAPLIQRSDRTGRIELADRAATTADQASSDGMAEPLQWGDLPPSPLDDRWGAFSAWTGDELLIWGGYAWSGGDGEGPRSDGAAFDGAAWSTLPAGPLPALMRHNGVAAWTGDELWIVGGTGGVDGTRLSRAAAAYRPATRRWRKLPAVPEPIGGGAWVGDQLVVVAAVTDGPRAVYTLRAGDDQWRHVDALPPPHRSSRDNSDLHVLATADHVAVVGLGRVFVLAAGPDAAGSDAAAWRRLPAPGGGNRLTNVRGAVALTDAFVVLLSNGTYRYDLGTRKWTRIADGLKPEPPQAIPLVRTGADDLVAVDVVNGGMYMLSDDGTWIGLAALDEPRVDATVEVAGDQVVIWGGMGSEQPDDGTQGWMLAAPPDS